MKRVNQERKFSVAKDERHSSSRPRSPRKGLRVLPAAKSSPPKSRRFCCSKVSSSNAFRYGMRSFLAPAIRPLSTRGGNRPVAMPPSSNGLPASAMTLSGSKSQRLPRPLHVSQAPYGLLNENERGSRAGTLAPHRVQASFSEYIFSAPPISTTTTRPPAILVAVRIEFSTRFAWPSRTAIRSTTTSMVWLRRRSRWMSSSSETISPSTRALRNPSRARRSNSFLYSPLRPRTMGARIITLRPSCSPRMRRTICSAAWRRIGTWQFGQNGVPIEAYSSLR